MDEEYRTTFGEPRSTNFKYRDTGIGRRNISQIKVRNGVTSLTVFLKSITHRPGIVSDDKIEFYPAVTNYIKYDDAVDTEFDLNEALKNMIFSKSNKTSLVTNILRVVQSIFGKRGSIDSYGMYRPSDVFNIYDPQYSDIYAVLMLLQKMCQVYLRSNISDVMVQHAQRRLISAWTGRNYDVYSITWAKQFRSQTFGSVETTEKRLISHLSTKVNIFNWLVNPNLSFDGNVKDVVTSFTYCYFALYGSMTQVHTRSTLPDVMYTLPNANSDLCSVENGRGHTNADAFLIPELMLILFSNEILEDVPLWLTVGNERDNPDHEIRLKADGTYAKTQIAESNRILEQSERVVYNHHVQK